MKGEVDILGNFPIDTSLKKKAHSAMLVLVVKSMLVSVVLTIFFRTMVSDGDTSSGRESVTTVIILKNVFPKITKTTTCR